VIHFELLALDSMSTIAVRYAQYLKEQLKVLHQILLHMDRLSFLINKEDKVCSHKYVVQK